MTGLAAQVIGLSSMCGAVVEHGPLVHWNQDPTKSCQVVWMERAGHPGGENKWALGPAGFGYGDGDDSTVFSNMKDRFNSVAIRRVVGLPAEVPKDAVLVLRMNYDDGFIAWLGGREIARRNIRGSGSETGAAGKHEAGIWEEIRLGRVDRFLSDEKVVLALKGFNDDVESSDFTLHPVLVAKSGRKEWPLVAPHQTWEYLANGSPEDGWQTRTLGLKADLGVVAKDFTLRYRAQGDGTWLNTSVGSRPFPDSGHRVLHAELKGLPGGRDIEFQVMAGGGDASETYRFRMPSLKPAPLRFVTGGDLYHERQPMDRMNHRAGAEDPLFALIGGDLAYANDAKPGRWLDYLDSWAKEARTPDGRLVPKVVAIGNHEILGAGYHPEDAPGPEAARMFYSLFQFPGGSDATHCVDLSGWLSLVMLDSGHTKNIAEQNSWLESELSKRDGVPQLFVCYHRPAWGTGVKPDSVEIQRDWCPLFEKHRVSAVFENDHHVFCRTHPIKAGAIDEAAGIPYLGSGSWSVKVRKTNPAEIRKRPWIAASGGINHLYVIDARTEGYVATAKDIDGNLIDRLERAWKR
jgi:hypothetical protein